MQEDMATMTLPKQLIVTLDSGVNIANVRRAISMLKGVTKVMQPRAKRMSSYERSLRDLEEGRVYEYDSLDDLIKEIEG
jgi:hypothetical protein